MIFGVKPKSESHIKILSFLLPSLFSFVMRLMKFFKEKKKSLSMFLLQEKIVRKNIISYCFCSFYIFGMHVRNSSNIIFHITELRERVYRERGKVSPRLGQNGFGSVYRPSCYSTIF